MFTKKREELVLSDIFYNKSGVIIGEYNDYNLIYKQDTNCLCRFPELLELFEKSYYIEYSENWSFFRIRKLARNYLVKDYDSTYDTRFVASIMHKAFSRCENLAIKIDHLNWIYVYDKPYYSDESFEVFRNRCLFTLREYLNIPHLGHGKDSIKLY